MLAAVALVALAGALVAFALSGGHGGAAIPGTTTVAAARTVTHPPSSTQSAATTSALPPTSSSLIARGEALMAQGKYLEALPLLQQANRVLNGSGTASEGRADADLALAIVKVGSCSGVVSLVVRADQLLGPQPQTDQLRTGCSAPPAPPPAHGHGGPHGKGNGKDG